MSCWCFVFSPRTYVSVFVTFMSWTLLFKPNEWMNEWTTCQTSRNFPYTLSMGVTALSSSDTNALPVLWMTPCLLIIGHKLRGWYGVYAQSDSPGGSSAGEVMMSIRLFCWCWNVSRDKTPVQFTHCIRNRKTNRNFLWPVLARKKWFSNSCNQCSLRYCTVVKVRLECIEN